MSKYYKLCVAVAMFLLQALSLNAYVIKGTVVDESEIPIRKAVIIGRNSANKVKVGVETDPMGQFSSVNVMDSTLLIEISKEGHCPIYINVAGTDNEFVDLGIIRLNTQVVNLDEVTVTAQSVIQKPDRYIIIPSSGEITQSSNGLSLLNILQYKMPGLVVNETLQSVKVDDKTPVFKINGKPSSLNQFLSLNPQEVLRIEYHDNPDVRYENRQIINVLLKPREDGGSVASNLSSAITTGCINGNIGANYHSKKSEWDLNYNVNWRDYDKREISSESDFIGRDEKIARKQIGMPAEFNTLINVFNLGYTYMYNPNTVFMAQLGLATQSTKLDDNSRNIQSYKNEIMKYTNLTHRNNDSKSPNIDLFFRKQIDNTQYLEANVYGRYSSGDYERDYINVYDDFISKDVNTTTFTANKSWRAGFELMYSKTFSYLTANLGVQEYYNSTQNEQTENVIRDCDKITQNRLSVYGQVSGRISKLRYSLSANGVYNKSDNNSYIVNAVRLKTNVNMNYPLSHYVTLNYLLMFDPSMPSISQQSSMIQTIDDISVRQGNPDLKPSEYLRNRIYIRYSIKKFTGSLWAAHSRTFDPIYYVYNYISDDSSPYYDKFISRPINGNHDDLVNLELNMSVQNLFGFATFWGKLGWDNYHIKLENEHYSKNRIYTSINGNFTFGNRLVSANYEIKPRYNLSGNIFSTAERWNTITFQYNYKNWYFSATGVNLFTKRGSTIEKITISEVHPEKYIQNIRNNANMVLLGATYRFDFGKRQKKVNRTLNNDGVERGVDINY